MRTPRTTATATATATAAAVLAAGLFSVVDARAQAPADPIRLMPARSLAHAVHAVATPRIGECGSDLRSEGPLTFMGAMQRVVCRHPVLAQAVLLVDERRALLALARDALRPRVSATVELASNRIPSSNSAAGSLEGSVTGYVGLSWLVFDFGQRDALIRSAQAQLDGAQSGREAAALAAINEAVRLYVEAAAANARFAAAVSNEETARQSLEIAKGRREGQVSSLADELQARTALAQAALERTRASSAWMTARGLLARAMDLPLDHPLDLAPPEQAFPRAAATVADGSDDSVRRLRSAHPRVRSMRSEVESFQARVEAAVAEGRGTLSLSAGAGTTRDLRTPGARFEHTLSGGAVANVPLFNAAEQRAREGQAIAQLESRKSALEAVEREVDADLWRGARLVESETGALQATRELQQTAAQSHEIALGRYRAGVGSIVELLAAQSALAGARAQSVQAQLAHAQAVLFLEVASGRVLLGR